MPNRQCIPCARLRKKSADLRLRSLKPHIKWEKLLFRSGLGTVFSGNGLTQRLNVSFELRHLLAKWI